MNYGDTYLPSGLQAPVKLRGPVWVGVMTLLTLGVYGIYYVFVNARHLRDYGDARGHDLGQRPGMTLLAMTLGWVVVVPPFVALFRQAQRIQQAQRIAGAEPMNGWIAFLLYLVVSPVFLAYEQVALNTAWVAEGAELPVKAAGGAVHAH